MRPVDYASLVERRCSSCGVTKPVAAFNRYEDRAAVLTGWLQALAERWRSGTNVVGSVPQCADELDALVRAASPDSEQAVIDDVIAHWFTQGGKAQFGDLPPCQNADEVVAAILSRVRAASPPAPPLPPLPPLDEPDFGEIEHQRKYPGDFAGRRVKVDTDVVRGRVDGAAGGVRSAGPPQEKEICICAAWLTDEGVVVRGHRHSHSRDTALTMHLTPASEFTSQGFITSRGRFVHRREALELQIAAGIKSVSPLGYRDVLFSEDLY